jgi:hypothetical protein
MSVKPGQVQVEVWSWQLAILLLEHLDPLRIRGRGGRPLAVVDSCCFTQRAANPPRYRAIGDPLHVPARPGFRPQASTSEPPAPSAWLVPGCDGFKLPVPFFMGLILRR